MDEDDVAENEEMTADAGADADDAGADAEAINSETDISVLSSRAAVYRPDFNITDDALLNVGWMIIKMDDEIGGDDHLGFCLLLGYQSDLLVHIHGCERKTFFTNPI